MMLFLRFTSAPISIGLVTLLKRRSEYWRQRSDPGSCQRALLLLDGPAWRKITFVFMLPDRGFFAALSGVAKPKALARASNAGGEARCARGTRLLSGSVSCRHRAIPWRHGKIGAARCSQIGSAAGRRSVDIGRKSLVSDRLVGSVGADIRD